MSTEIRLLTAVREKVTPQEVRRFFIEAAFLLGASIVYYLIRGGVPDRAAEAFSRANQVIHLEQKLGIFVELRWQEYIIDNVTLVKLANWIYVWGHLPVLIFAVIWIYLRSHDRYRLYRNAFLLSGFIGLFGYGFFPVAPPRLMPEWGFVDTVAIFTSENYEMQPGFFVNHYAAVPSLHFGWALLIAIALFDVDRSFWVRAFAVVMTAAMFFAVVLTANHFIFDMLVGSLVVLIALALAILMENGRFAPWRALKQRVRVRR